jgi:hypothetical protein
MNTDFLQDSDLINKTIDLSKGGISLDNEEQTAVTLEKNNSQKISSVSSSPLENNSIIQNLKLKLKNCSDKFNSFITPYTEKVNIQPNYKIFFSLLGVGAFFMVLSLFTLPFFILSPTRFVMSFSLANIFILTSFTFYYGGKEYISMLLSENRRWITFGFLISLIIGLIFAWRKYFFLSLLLALCQLIVVVMFVLTFLPYGKNGINCMIQFAKGWLFNLLTKAKEKVLKKGNSDLPV